MKKILFLIILLKLSSTMAASSCRSLFTTPFKISETSVTVYLTVDFGYHDKILAGNFVSQKRRIMAVIPDEKDQRVIPLDSTPSYLMPGTRDDEATYFAKMTIQNGRSVFEFYPVKDSRKLDKMLDEHFNLVWKVYEEEGTVTKDEVDSFIKTEHELAPQRKNTFVVADPKTGRTLGIMRLYDGSPFPTNYFGDLATHHEAPDTDRRLPIERRYPEINLRQKTDFIFEPGRLAKSSDIEDGILEFKFHHMGFHLLHKFGFRGWAPQSYFTEGRVYIEITSRNLKKFMRPRKDSGYGFHLTHAKRGNGKMKKVRSSTSYEDLKIDARKDADSKFILSCTVQEFINNFYEESVLVDVKKIDKSGL